MKKQVILLAIIAVSSLPAMAQNAAKYKSNYPYWTISKEIQRQQFKDVTYAPVVPVTGDVALVASKNVQRVNVPKQFLGQRVQMGGTPAHVISKGVARVHMNGKK